MSPVEVEIRAFVTTYGIQGPGVVAVSGGADSVALLRGCLDAGLTGVSVGHFNHKLRGRESDADEDFVRELAGKLGVSFLSGSGDVAAKGGNLEATARKMRYGWLAQVAAEKGAKWVATGHTADDQAETVLHRLVRGTGIQGLRGIGANRAPDKPNGPRLIRPLLTVTRDQIIDYLAELRQRFCEDATNADRRFTRNRIRHELLPMLKTFNPQIVDILGRLAGQADDATGFIAVAAKTLLEKVQLPQAGNVVVIEARPLQDSHPFLVREMFRLLWDREEWPTNGMTRDHWQHIWEIAVGTAPAGDFPEGVYARRAGAVVQLGRRT